MAILDVDVCYIACIFGNTINDFVCRRIDRNLEEEKKLIEMEKDFWENNVLLNIPPMLHNQNSILDSPRTDV